MKRDVGLLPEDIKIKCFMCGEVNTAKDWDETSYKECVNREERRCYISIREPKVFSSRSTKIYMCPNCKDWIRARTLKIISDDSKYTNLGGHQGLITEEFRADVIPTYYPTRGTGEENEDY